MARARGFTLVELVLVMVIVSVGLLGMSRVFSNSAIALKTVERWEQVAQAEQECAEKVLSLRKASGISAVTSSTTCPAALSNSNLNAATVAVSTNTAQCPTGVTCKTVAITVTTTSGVTPVISSTVTLLLADY
jgi:prepilin-type N-terminal cleavage/methylation domain-containing protein